MNTDNPNTPIVLLHGYVSALAFWMLNFDEFAAHRPVYAIDLLGFGRSSRPIFSKDPLEIEEQYVEFLERWREQMNIPKMILLGHSLGGFIVSCYALKYPERVEHLILADPWGFTPHPDLKQFNVAHRLGLKFFQRFPPFSLMRMAGPLTAPFFRLCRQDIIGKFEKIYDVPQRRIVSEYVTHCNNISITGEQAFHRLMKNGPWPVNPIGEKMRLNVCKTIPITFIYGEKSWLDPCYGQHIKESRPDSHTAIHMIQGVGHKVMSDDEKIFNQIVNEACKILKSQYSVI
jgi:abhydrolase domain-containing protein 4